MPRMPCHRATHTLGSGKCRKACSRRDTVIWNCGWPSFWNAGLQTLPSGLAFTLDAVLSRLVLRPVGSWTSGHRPPHPHPVILQPIDAATSKQTLVEGETGQSMTTQPQVRESTLARESLTSGLWAIGRRIVLGSYLPIRSASLPDVTVPVPWN